MTAIDICLVSARRPDLLRRTLESFQFGLFKNFEIRGVYANIDPIFGDASDHKKTIGIIQSFFPDTDIRSPEVPGFCAAVQANWRRTTAEYVMHLEDDWLLNVPVLPSILRKFSNKRLAQVAFNTKEKCWDIEARGISHYRLRNFEFFGRKTSIQYKFPEFTTSPSFLRGSFARRVAELYDTRFDPEKQFTERVNPSLERFVSRFYSEILGTSEGFIITDTGREWRDQRGIKKVVRGGTTRWRGPRSMGVEASAGE